MITPNIGMIWKMIKRMIPGRSIRWKCFWKLLIIMVCMPPVAATDPPGRRRLRRPPGGAGAASALFQFFADFRRDFVAALRLPVRHELVEGVEILVAHHDGYERLVFQLFQVGPLAFHRG